MAEAMVLAVYIPPQAPAPGQEFLTTPKKSSSEICPVYFFPNASNAETIFNFFIPNDTSIITSKQIGSYESTFHNHTFKIILSGFIGRIDDWSKRRLGLEIENAIDKLNIYL